MNNIFSLREQDFVRSHVENAVKKRSFFIKNVPKKSASSCQTRHQVVLPAVEIECSGGFHFCLA